MDDHGGCGVLSQKCDERGPQRVGVNQIEADMFGGAR